MPDAGHYVLTGRDGNVLMSGGDGEVGLTRQASGETTLFEFRRGRAPAIWSCFPEAEAGSRHGRPEPQDKHPGSRSKRPKR